MSNRETLDYDPVDALIEQGRRELADGKVEKAQWCFEEVLRRRPDEPRALLGLSYAARKSESPPSSDAYEAAERKEGLEEAASVLSVDVEVVVLVREKRYGEALLKLRAELSKRPEDRALLRSIAHLEKHIARGSARPEKRVSESPIETIEGPGSSLSPSQITKLRVPDIKGTKIQETQDFEAPQALIDEAESAKGPTPFPTFVTQPVGTRSGVQTQYESKTSPELPLIADTSPTGDAWPTVDVSPRVQATPKTAQTPELEPSPTPTASTGIDFDPSVTQPFELRKVASTRRKTLDEAETNAGEAELDKSLIDSGETRIPNLTSSGGFQIADEDPSGPALGSLPPTPSAAPSKGSGSTWWIFGVLVIIAIAAAFVLR